MTAQLPHYLIAIYQSRSECLYLAIQHVRTLPLLPQQFQFAGEGTLFIILKAGTKGCVLITQVTAMLHKVHQ